MRPLLLAALLPLAACGGGGPGTTISINASDANGNVAFGADANGQLAIDSPLFKGKLKLPKIQLNASDFDMNGVHLYPGSTISGMTIDAKDGAASGDKDGGVRVSFESPAAPAVVRDWFRDKLTTAGFKVADDGTGLSGKTDENDPFKLDLDADGANRSKGRIAIN